jgi:hypothetical protein
MAKTITKATTRKSHPRTGLKNQQATALITVHNRIPRLPRISNDFEYPLLSLLIGFNPRTAMLHVALIANP